MYSRLTLHPCPRLNLDLWEDLRPLWGFSGLDGSGTVAIPRQGWGLPRPGHLPPMDPEDHT